MQRGVDCVGGNKDPNTGGGIGEIRTQVAGLVETRWRRVWQLKREVDQVQWGDKTGEGGKGQGSALGREGGGDMSFRREG